MTVDPAPTSRVTLWREASVSARAGHIASPAATMAAHISVAREKFRRTVFLFRGVGVAGQARAASVFRVGIGCSPKQLVWIGGSQYAFAVYIIQMDWTDDDYQRK
jgi:hypothetical protein